MVDPDAPSPTAPSERSWLHWLVVDVDGNTLNTGTVHASYNPPTPPQGIHRYVLLAFKQNGGVPTDNNFENTRGKFNVKAYAAANSLGNPVAGNFFKAQPEPNVNCPGAPTPAPQDCKCQAAVCKTGQVCQAAGTCQGAGPNPVGNCPAAPTPAQAACQCGPNQCTVGQICQAGGACQAAGPGPIANCPAAPTPAQAACQCGPKQCTAGQVCQDANAGTCQAPGGGQQPGGATDRDPNCDRYSGLCNNAAYKATMTQNCALTCARASGAAPPAPCVDRNPSCASWGNFCRNSYYSVEQKKYYCQKTCNFC
ncbi:MFT1 protein [Aphelenchoides avenae]|nr:MFT1 protein [Aphelenchus avenae]